MMNLESDNKHQFSLNVADTLTQNSELQKARVLLSFQL